MPAGFESTPTWRNNRFSANGAGVPGLPNPNYSLRGQFTLDIGTGHRINPVLSGNAFEPSPISGILVYNGTLLISYPSATGVVNLMVDHNDIRNQGRDGITLLAVRLQILGPVSENEIFDNGGDGIDNQAVWFQGDLRNSISSPDIVNNWIGFNGTDASGLYVRSGVFNHVGSSTGAAPPAPTVLAVQPTLVHDTIAYNPFWGLQNGVNPGTAAALLQVFQVWNALFDMNGISDLTPTPVEVGNIWYSRFLSPFPTQGPNAQWNIAVAPSLSSPGTRDFALLPGSLMVDQASLNPPVFLAVAILGGRRQGDIPGTPNASSGDFADIGGHERQF